MENKNLKQLYAKFIVSIIMSSRHFLTIKKIGHVFLSIRKVPLNMGVFAFFINIDLSDAFSACLALSRGRLSAQFPMPNVLNFSVCSKKIKKNPNQKK